MRFTSILTITPTLLLCANACLDEASPGDDPVTAESVDAIEPGLTVASAEITAPAPGAVVRAGPLTVEGHAVVDIDPALGLELAAELTIDGQRVTDESVRSGITFNGSNSIDYSITVPGLAPGEHEICSSLTNVAAPGVVPTPLACSIIFTIPHRDPVPVCEDQRVVADGSCEVLASIDGGSYDPDGDPFDCTAYPPGPYGVGITDVTLDCRDDQGGGGACNAIVEVLDGSPVDIQGASIVLWPPDHTIHEFTLADCIGTASQCGDAEIVYGDHADYGDYDLQLVSLTSDEQENSIGDGNTCDDTLMITGDTSFAIRSERQGGEDGRVYRATYRVRDVTGYESYAVCEISVPKSHNQAAVDSGCALCLDAVPNDGEGCGGCPLLADVCQ